METRSLHSDGNPSRKRSFTLPSFRKTAREQQSVDSVASAAEEAVRVRKAAAWQWHTRGLGEVVVPTKRPAIISSALVPTPTNVADATVAGGTSPTSNVDDGSARILKKPHSRFEVEARTRGRAPAAGAPLPIPPLAAAPSTPLYDEVELSGLKSQMADFLQRLQVKQQPEDEQKGTAKVHTSDSHQLVGLPADVKSEPATIRRSSSSSTESPAFFRPISALHRFFRRVISGRFQKSSSAPVPLKLKEHEAELVVEQQQDPQADDVRLHYHHYIHHHHHHHHYSPGLEEAEYTPRPRRHSESSGLHPRIPALIWEENETDVSGDSIDEKESPISSFLARRRRHSDSNFAEVNKSTRGNLHGGGAALRPATNGDSAKPGRIELPSPRRYNSERYTNVSKVAKESKDEPEVVKVQERGDVQNRRRYSSESLRDDLQGRGNVAWRKGAAMEEAMAARVGEGVERGVYKLSAAEAIYEGSRPRVLGRRHSDSYDMTRRRAEEAAEEASFGYAGGGGRGGGYEKEALKGWLRSPSPGASRPRQPRRPPLPAVYRL